jgi:hypothetical protein
MLIKSYGLYWNPDIIDWGSVGAGNSGELTGVIKRKKKSHEINFWEARGIYVLHADFKSVYVGKAYRTSIGKRLRDHLSDRFAGRWDMFSWFSISNPRITQADVSTPGQRQLGPEVITSTLEALAILVSDPALNRKRESLSDAYEALQPKGAKPKTIRNYLEELLEHATRNNGS